MAPEQAANGGAEQHSLLVVMADSQIRTTVAKYLRRCGIEVREAASADDSIELKDLRCDAVLVDISDPVDGFALAERMHYLHPYAPLVLSISHRYLAHDVSKLRKHLPELQIHFDQAALRRRLKAAKRRVRRPIEIGA